MRRTAFLRDSNDIKAVARDGVDKVGPVNLQVLHGRGQGREQRGSCRQGSLCLHRGKGNLRCPEKAKDQKRGNVSAW